MMIALRWELKLGNYLPFKWSDPSCHKADIISAGQWFPAAQAQVPVTWGKVSPVRSNGLTRWSKNGGWYNLHQNHWPGSRLGKDAPANQAPDRTLCNITAVRHPQPAIIRPNHLLYCRFPAQITPALGKNWPCTEMNHVEFPVSAFLPGNHGQKPFWNPCCSGLHSSGIIGAPLRLQ